MKQATSHLALLFDVSIPGSIKMVSLRSTKEFDPTYRFTTSWILSPAALFFVRALLSTYAFVTIFFILGYDGTHGGKAGQTFSYFTSLTYWGLAFYYLFAALHTGWYWQKGKPLLANWPRPLQEAHSAFYTTITVFPFLVTSTCDGCFSNRVSCNVRALLT